jgi:5'-AMP-activated protein kinase catalytic alpha subunit
LQVVHRDIKLENILLDAQNGMKIIDFGLAAFYATGKKLRVHCGSPSYAAPEIVARKQYEGPPVDVWSLGVVLFAMMAGFLPFHSPTGNKQVSSLWKRCLHKYVCTSATMFHTCRQPYS